MEKATDKPKMLNLIYPLVVEGKYDKVKVTSLVASPVITLGGFSVFKSPAKLTELKAFAASGGLIILTDSDKAGTFIRGKLKSLLPGIRLINVYSPVINGTDNRRNHTNKEGILGVESISVEALRAVLLPLEADRVREAFLDKTRAYADGICGRADSSAFRSRLCVSLGLPEGISANHLIEYINNFVDEEKYLSLLVEAKA